MSKFMDFLDNVQKGTDDNVFESVDNEIIEEETTEIGTIVEEVVESSKDVSVKIIESRIRLKLDEVGFNEKLVDEIISEVFKGVDAVKGIEEQADEVVVKENAKPLTVASRAESILGGMSDSGTYDPHMPAPSGPVGERRLSGVADHASSLL